MPCPAALPAHRRVRLGRALHVVQDYEEYEWASLSILCDRATGRETLLRGVLGGEALPISGDVIVAYSPGGYKENCEVCSISTYDFRRQMRLRTVKQDRIAGCGDGFGAQGLAVTAGGRVAWIGGSSLWAMPVEGDGPVVRLDSGQLGDLTADGERFRWTVDGAPRSE